MSWMRGCFQWTGLGYSWGSRANQHMGLQAKGRREERLGTKGPRREGQGGVNTCVAGDAKARLCGPRC